MVTGEVALPDGGELRILADISALEFNLPGRTQAFTAAVLIGLPAANMATILDQLASDLGLTVILAFVAFGLGVYLLSRQVLSPVQRVTHAASRVTGRDLSQRVPVPRTDDEMRELAVTINRMLERLQESFETQRRFTADASHELRTPVTAIVGHASYLPAPNAPEPRTGRLAYRHRPRGRADGQARQRPARAGPGRRGLYGCSESPPIWSTFSRRSTWSWRRSPVTPKSR